MKLIILMGHSHMKSREHYHNKLFEKKKKAFTPALSPIAVVPAPP
jgi:hypothetical protein